MEITVKNEIEEIEGPKRFYIPGLKIQCVCPKCSLLIESDYSKNYFSYPRIGPKKNNTEFLYCQNCEQEIEISVNIDLIVSVLAAKKIVKEEKIK